MDKTRKKQLERKGWRIGNTKEFLGLTDEESAYIELKRNLARSVRDRRTRKRLTQVELAKLLESSQSRVAKMEAGDPSVSLDLLVRCLLALGTSRRELAGMIASGKVAPAT